ncbi:hypothetical protein Gotur_022823 [Gossypium turneri]
MDYKKVWEQFLLKRILKTSSKGMVLFHSLQFYAYLT